MNWIFWTFFVASVSIFSIVSAFPYVILVKGLREDNIWTPPEMTVIAIFWLVLGYPADVVYNIFRGSMLFREFPRELMFSSRVQRHINESRGKNLEMALKWAVILNRIDPKPHIKIPQRHLLRYKALGGR